MNSRNDIPTVGTRSRTSTTTSTGTNTRTMTGVDDESHHQYRKEVLQLPSEELEVARAVRLEEEAHQLGLKVPEIEMAASLTASLASGLVDISSPSPVLSSGSSTCEGSSSTTAACGVAPVPTGSGSGGNGVSGGSGGGASSAPTAAAGAEPANSAPSGYHNAVSPLEQASSSLSELTSTASPSSRPFKSGSVRSLASFSTRPASFCSNDAKWIYGYGAVSEKSTPARLLQPQPQRHQHQHQHQQQQQQQHQRATNRHSMMSVVSGDNSNYNNNKKSKRRSSLMSAFGKLPFRRKRASSSVLLTPEAQITVTKGELGEDKVFVESKQAESSTPSATTQPDTHAATEAETGHTGDSNESSMMRLEIPVFDHESLQRSLVNPELVKMREAQWLERSRHVAFQEAFMSRLRYRQQAVVADRLAENKRIEDEKREQISANIARMEERQLAVEIEQQREFERAKQNARTRIKHMEGYFNTRSPPSSPSSSGTESLLPQQQPRQYTEQQKAQLAQEYHYHRSMDQLHESKIKVLRERQERRLFEASERMDNELDDLIDKHAEGFAELQKQHQHEEAAHLQTFEAKKTKLRHRWNLEEAIHRRRLELQLEVPFGPLPPLTFTDSHYDTRDSAICVSDNAGEDGHHHHKQHQHQHQQRGEGAMF